jgi:hypothetical protein
MRLIVSGGYSSSRSSQAPQATRELLSRDANVANHDQDGEFLVHAAVKLSPEVVTALLDKGAPFSSHGPQGRMPLHEDYAFAHSS